MDTRAMTTFLGLAAGGAVKHGASYELAGFAHGRHHCVRDPPPRLIID
jgi:hypothetical protein